MHCGEGAGSGQRRWSVTIMEVLWLFLGGVLGAVVACAIPYSAVIVERLVQGAARRPAPTLEHPNDRR